MRARDILRVSYLKAFIVSIVLAFAAGDIRGFSFETRNWWDGGIKLANGETMKLAETPVILIGIIGGISMYLILIIAIHIFVGLPLEVGAQRYFIESTKEKFDMNSLGYSFGQGNYVATIKTMFLRNLYIFLWSLLLVIPGIIKAYSYRMIPYILAENPQLDTKRVFEISKEMTKGEKFNMLILDLSFIGWYFLGALALGLGVFLVFPYQNATFAELYVILRQKAFANGVCKESELNHEYTK